MQPLLKVLFTIGPLLFGLGFIAPVFAALVEAAGITLPYEAPPLYVGLGLGLVLGTIASRRGAWI
jgi:hypothetical protein